MVLKVVPATEADASRAVEIETIAYGPNPAADVMFPGPFPPNPEGTSPRATVIADMLRKDPACRWAKVIDTDLEDRPDEDPMVAFSMWYFWDTPQPAAPPQDWGPGNNTEACELFFGGMREKRNAIFEGRPFVYLKLLHTHPDHMRRGAGSMLLQWGTTEADRLGLDSFLEATPEGKPLYERHGFKEIELFLVDFSRWSGPKDYPASLMLRPASK